MSDGSCAYCGGEKWGETAHCSAACDLAARLPLGERDLPATWQLGVLLGWMFVGFNQILFFGMWYLAMGQGDRVSAGGFRLASLGAGGLLFFISTLFFAISKPKTGVDKGGFFGSIGLGIVAVIAASQFLVYPEMYGALLGNILIVCWLTRGLWQKRASKKKKIG